LSSCKQLRGLVLLELINVYSTVETVSMIVKLSLDLNLQKSSWRRLGSTQHERAWTTWKPNWDIPQAYQIGKGILLGPWHFGQASIYNFLISLFCRANSCSISSLSSSVRRDDAFFTFFIWSYFYQHGLPKF
jgi:hypothetical protein